MSAQLNSLGDVVEVAEMVTSQPIEDRVVDAVRGELDDSAKARVYDLYDEGEISENVARELLGDNEFEVAERMTEGTESLLDEDPSKFTVGD